VVRETCDELLATFVAPEGGFYSATDADSEGEEGKFFVWTEAEVRAVLGAGDDCERFLQFYDVAEGPNFEGANVLHVASLDEDAIARLAPARTKLRLARDKRPKPLRDEKVLAAWNGLAISAFAIAGRVFEEPRYVAAAAKAAGFVLETMRAGGSLVRSYCHGRLGSCEGFLDDHAFVAAGLLDLFESTGEPRWFASAVDLCEHIESRFGDPKEGGWFMTTSRHDGSETRQRYSHDGAEPSGSSVALMNAARLAHFTDDSKWHMVVDRALAYDRPKLNAQPLAMTEALLAVDFIAGPTHEIVLAFPPGDDADGRRLRQVVAKAFCPRKILVTGLPASPAWQDLASRIPLIGDKAACDGRATAYVCHDRSCERPTSDPAQLMQQIAT
jgi:uncharacterized protein YyaL (SSP411 family)